MPIYVYQCSEHGDFDSLEDVGRLKVKCPKCGGLATRDFGKSISGVKANVFESYWHYGFGMKIDSMQQLKDECKRRGCVSPYAEGSGSVIDGDRVEVTPLRERPRKVASVAGIAPNPKGHKHENFKEEVRKPKTGGKVRVLNDKEYHRITGNL